MWREYHQPTSLDEAVRLLNQYDGMARVVAGGTDLFIDMGAGAHAPLAALVDVTRIEGLDDIRQDDGWIVIGAAVTHTDVVAASLVQRHGQCLAESCGVVGGPQVRNVGTLCGNVAHGLPAADGTVSLLALAGEALVVGQTSRWIPLEEFFLGPGRVALDSTRQVLAAVRFRPTGARQGSAFHRIMRPQGIALPILGMAAVVTLDAPGARIEDARVAVGPVAPVPFRARAAETALLGQAPTEATLAAAAQALVAEAHPRTSPHRATKEYRHALLPALLRRVLVDAIMRARIAR